MSRQTQAEFALRVKMILLKRKWSVVDLAARIDRPRQTVSGSIHHQRFPKVRALVKEALGL